MSFAHHFLPLKCTSSSYLHLEILLVFRGPPYEVFLDHLQKSFSLIFPSAALCFFLSHGMYQAFILHCVPID